MAKPLLKYTQKISTAAETEKLMLLVGNTNNGSQQFGRITTWQTESSQQCGRITTWPTESSQQCGRITTWQTESSQRCGKITTSQTESSQQCGKITTSQTESSQQMSTNLILPTLKWTTNKLARLHESFSVQHWKSVSLQLLCPKYRHKNALDLSL